VIFSAENVPAGEEWVQGVLSQCSQPELAFQSWLERNAQLGKRVKAQARRLGLPVLVGELIEMNLRTVEGRLLPPAA
jgi:hypothetical protein